MNKLISERKDAMAKILTGVNLVSNPVVSSIGPLGRTVLIAQSFVENYMVNYLPVICTKDGYEITKSISSTDPEIQVGVRLMQQISEVQMEKMGDATSTVCLFAQALITDGLKLIDSGKNYLEVIKGINDAVEYVSAEMTKMATPISGNVEKIRMVATVTSNNDSFIGDLIAESFSKIGEYGVIDIQEAKSRETSIKVSDGIKFGRGWVSQYFVTNKVKGQAELINPYILLYDRPITQLNDKQFGSGILPLIQKITTNGKRPLVIFCDDCDGEALATLTFNTQQNNFQSCVISMSFLGDNKRDFMNDIAAATSGTFISELAGVKLENVTIEMLGQADKVVVSKDDTVIIGGLKNENVFNDLVKSITSLEENEEDIEQKRLLKKRVARLKGSVAILSVGGITEIEMKEKAARIDDAVRSTRSSILGGWVAGGGTAFLRVPVIGGNDGWNLVMSILSKPLNQICINAGKEPKEIIDNVLRNIGNIGYNAKSDKIEDLSVSGIIEPVDSNISALQNAASVACQILSSKYLITDTL